MKRLSLVFALLCGLITTAIAAPSGNTAPRITTEVQAGNIIHRVDTIAALRQLAGGPGKKAVQVMGYYAAADGGGGPVRVWDAASTCTDNGGSCIDPAASGAGRWVWIYSGPVTVGWYGAYKDATNAAATTAAIQAALDAHPDVIAGAGSYLLNATLRVRRGGVSFRGDSTFTTNLIRTDGTYGDTILVSADDPATTRLVGFTLSDMRIDCDSAMTTGAHLAIKDTIQVSVESVHLWDGYISMRLEGVQNGTFRHTVIDTGAYYSSGVVAGSRYVQILAANNPANETGELSFSDFNWTHTINNSTEIGLDIQAGDGHWFSNGHVFGAGTELRISPQTNTTQLQGLHFSSVWFDQFCIYNIVITGNSTAGYGDFEFTGCVGLGGATSAILIDASATNLRRVNFVGGRYGSTGGTIADIQNGSGVTFSCTRIFNGNINNAGTFYGISVGTGVSDLLVVGCYIGNKLTNGAPLSGGINFLDATLVAANISGNHFEGCTSEIILTNHLLEGSRITACTTDRADYEDTPAGSVLAPATVTEIVEITGTSQTINTITYGWSGRRILLRPVDNSQTIRHNVSANNSRIFTATGADVVLTTGQAMTLTYNAGRSSVAAGWYQSQ